MLHRFALATVVATWLLIVIGGTVNPTGSSLACPDWYFVPTCYGEVFPADWSGGVLFEHGHRMWASLVGLLTIILAVALWRSARVGRTTARLGVAAVLLVALQGTLGGITVKLGLSPTISTLHLTLAMAFFALLVLLAERVRAAGAPAADDRPALPRGLVAAAALLVAGQIVLGGLVRHFGAGLVCGDDWLLCGPEGLWPSLGLAQLHMTHRLVGYGAAVVVALASARAARSAAGASRPDLARLAWVPAGAVLLQVVLGLVTVATAREPVVVALHTAVAGLILGALLVLWLRLGPADALRDAPEPAPTARRVEALT